MRRIVSRIVELMGNKTEQVHNLEITFIDFKGQHSQHLDWVMQVYSVSVKVADSIYVTGHTVYSEISESNGKEDEAANSAKSKLKTTRKVKKWLIKLTCPKALITQ